MHDKNNANQVVAPSDATGKAVSIDVQVFAIDVEKRLCAALGRQWSPVGISIDSLIDDLKRKADATGKADAASAGDVKPEWAIYREIWFSDATPWQHTTATYANFLLHNAEHSGGTGDKTYEVRWLVPLPGSVSVTKGVRTDTTTSQSPATSAANAGDLDRRICKIAREHGSAIAIATARAIAAEIGATSAADATDAEPWTKTPPTEQADYWNWDGDPDHAPMIYHVLWSGTAKKCFVSMGQYGIDRAIWCDEFGGWWLKIEQPSIPEGDAAIAASRKGGEA